MRRSILTSGYVKSQSKFDAALTSNTRLAQHLQLPHPHLARIRRRFETWRDLSRLDGSPRWDGRGERAAKSEASEW